MPTKETLQTGPNPTAPIELAEGTSAVEYAHQVTENNVTWGVGRRDQPRELFTTTVDQNFRALIEERSVEELEAAKQALVDYGRGLREQITVDKWGIAKYPSGYLQWLMSLRVMSRLSWRVQAGDANKHIAVDDLGQSSESFWQEVFAKTAGDESSRLAFNSYVMGPKIAGKDPSILSDVVEQLQTEPVEEVLPGLPYSDPISLRRRVFDNFSNIIKEASESGWRNASVLEALLAKIPKRDVPLHAVIVEMGNQVTALLNRQAAVQGEAALNPLNHRSHGHTAEAINRCMHIMFEYGKPPEDQDPLNYLLTGQIITRLSNEADERLQKQGIPPR